MSAKLKKALIVAVAAFLSVITSYSVSPDALENICIKLTLCEAAK